MPRQMAIYQQSIRFFPSAGLDIEEINNEDEKYLTSDVKYEQSSLTPVYIKIDNFKSRISGYKFIPNEFVDIPTIALRELKEFMNIKEQLYIKGGTVINMLTYGTFFSQFNKMRDIDISIKDTLSSIEIDSFRKKLTILQDYGNGFINMPSGIKFKILFVKSADHDRSANMIYRNSLLAKFEMIMLDGKSINIDIIDPEFKSLDNFSETCDGYIDYYMNTACFSVNDRDDYKKIEINHKMCYSLGRYLMHLPNESPLMKYVINNYVYNDRKMEYFLLNSIIRTSKFAEKHGLTNGFAFYKDLNDECPVCSNSDILTSEIIQVSDLDSNYKEKISVFLKQRAIIFKCKHHVCITCFMQLRNMTCPQCRKYIECPISNDVEIDNENIAKYLKINITKKNNWTTNNNNINNGVDNPIMILKKFINHNI